MTSFSKIVIAGTVGVVIGFFSGVYGDNVALNDSFAEAKALYEPICVRSIETSPEEAVKAVPDGERRYVAAFCAAYFKGAQKNFVSHP